MPAIRVPNEKIPRKRVPAAVVEIRPAKEHEVKAQKEIWRLCFHDSDAFIDAFFNEQYLKQQTMLYLYRGEIASRLTMLPVKLATPRGESIPGTMLYAIATHPRFQNRGFAGQLIRHTHKFLCKCNAAFTVLVPAGPKLFGFYRRLGYADGFSIREGSFSEAEIQEFPEEGLQAEIVMESISAREYNGIRNQLLRGTWHVKYTDEEVAYQKLLSRFTGGDIYGIHLHRAVGAVGAVGMAGEVGAVSAVGVACVEHSDRDKVIIKEILINDKYLTTTLRCIARQHPARDYTVRTPCFLGKKLNGIPRVFCMIKMNGGSRLDTSSETQGYLGLAFD